MSTLQEGPEVQAMWCSWLPALTRALVESTGPVLEIGVGHFSTPFLHEYCDATKRHLVSVEADAEWGFKFAEMFRSDNHEVIVQDYAFILPILDRKFGLVFIDNSPGGAGRSIPFRQFIQTGAKVVVHDYHLENSDAIDPIIKEFNANRIVYDKYRPPTLLSYL